jgi:malonyl-CoA decarboxylase
MPTVWKDTLDNLRKGWLGIAESMGGTEKIPVLQPNLGKADIELVKKRMHACLEARGGEVSARQRAAQLGEIYLTLSQQGRRRFLELLAKEFAADRQAVAEAAAQLSAGGDQKTYLAAEEHLRQVLFSPRLRLLKQFTALPQGVKFLVGLRADLLEFMAGDPNMESLDTELRHLLATWFDVGFLECRHITWESPAALLEKLIAYEAVHTIHSWKDLRNRLESDRRCYAFFHPAMADEPLIFIEIALVRGMAGHIQPLLDESAPEVRLEQTDTAIFYSITNAQKGLRGISFGHFLIKRVVDELRHELPNLKTFATLSPIPGFRRWLEKHLEVSDDEPTVALQQGVAKAARLLEVPEGFSEVISHPAWHQRSEVAMLLREPLMKLCARYLHQTRSDHAPLDAVERFHLGNGARIERLNWLGDTSANGLRQSCGLMVNYLYRLEDIEKNHEAYATRKRIVASPAVRALLKEPAGDSGKGRFSKMLRMAMNG